MNVLWLALKTLGSLFVVACALRAYLQAVRLHPQNPVSQLTFQMTDWIVRPIRRLVPGFGGFDWASALAGLLIALCLAVIFYFLMAANLLPDADPLQKPVRPFGWIAALAVLWAVKWCVQFAVVILIVGVALSWINPMHPLKPVFDLLAEPLLAPFRWLFGKRRRPGQSAPAPSIGFDLSPIGAFLMLQILAMWIAELEQWVARQLF